MTPAIEIEVMFLSEKKGGRVYMPQPGYRPHLVRGGEYLGVEFVKVPDNYLAETVGIFQVALTYHPKQNYDRLVTGAIFTIREGSRIVGFGKVKRDISCGILHSPGQKSLAPAS
jgi:hypothetical protein